MPGPMSLQRGNACMVPGPFWGWVCPEREASITEEVIPGGGYTRRGGWVYQGGRYTRWVCQGAGILESGQVYQGEVGTPEWGWVYQEGWYAIVLECCLVKLLNVYFGSKRNLSFLLS